MDWKKWSKFSVDQETDRLLRGLRGWQDSNGDWMDYFRYDYQQTRIDPIYGEAAYDPSDSQATGRRYKHPVRVPALHVTHMEGGQQKNPYGFYFNDDLYATVAFDLFIQMGMNYADIETQNYLKDRIRYERKIFRVTNISIRGQIQRRDTIVGISATEVKPDELVDDAMFAQWSLPVNEWES